VSRNSGTRRIREDTQGHDQGANQAQEDTGGAAGIRKDTTLGRFGTVRPRVQIPGPRPKIVFKSRSSPAPSGATGLQGGHRLPWNEVTTAPSKWISNRRLNSLTVIAEPIYQHAHGLRTVRHPGSEFQGRSGWSVTAATRHEVEQTSLNHLRCVWLYPYARRQLHQRLRSPDLCLSVRGVTSSRTPSRARSMKPVKTSPVSGPPGKSTRR